MNETSYPAYISYLAFGYLYTARDYCWLTEAYTHDPVGEYTVGTASQQFDKLFDDLVGEARYNNHLVPLSGGWDSRAILGGLLERVETSQIQTVSFGTEGQLDFDIGKKIAQKFGLKHLALDLNKIELSWEALLDSVKASPWTYVPDAYFNAMARNSCRHTNTWTGFLGDPLTGSHLSDKYRSFDQMADEFMEKQRRSNPKDLLPIDYYPRLGPNEEEHIKTNLNWDDFFDLTVRQANCIAPIVLPIKRWKGWEDCHIIGEYNDAIAPFAKKDWVSYWLNVPRSLKKNQSLYLEMLNVKFPDLFGMPAKAYFGASGAGGPAYYLNKFKHKIKSRLYHHFPSLNIKSNMMVNYLDFNTAFRKRQDYQQVLMTAADYLEKKEICPWINVRKMIDDHSAQREGHGTNFLLLIGLALNLEVNSDIII